MYHFDPWFYQIGSLEIVFGPQASVGLSLNISETAPSIFLEFCMKLGHHKGTKVTESNFLKEILRLQMGDNLYFGRHL